MTSEVDASDIDVKAINFKGKYNRLNDFTLMQTFNLTPLKAKEVDE